MIIKLKVGRKEGVKDKQSGRKQVRYAANSEWATHAWDEVEGGHVWVIPECLGQSKEPSNN